MRGMLRATALLVILASLIFSVAPALADFGDFDTGGDYGGWDSDYDYDYDSGWSSSGSRGDADVNPVAAMLFMLLWPFFILARRAVEVIRQAVDRLRYRMSMHNAKALHKADPGFDATAFNAWVQNLYTHMQADWERGDLSDLRQEFTPECLSRFEKQLEAKKTAGFQGHVRDISFLSIELIGWSRKGQKAYLDVRLRVRICSWNTDRDGAITTGSKTEPKIMEYLWRLQRPADARTDAEPVACPNCAAKQSRLMARCSNCDAALTRDPDEWKLYDISGIPEHLKRQ